MKFGLKIFQKKGKYDSRRRLFKSQPNSTIRPIIITTILSSLSTLIITYFGFILSRDQEQEMFLKSKVFDYQMYVLSERRNLLERAHSILYKRRLFYNLEITVNMNQQLAKLSVGLDDRFDKQATKLLESSKELNGLVAEYAAIMALSEVYFGPKTQMAVHRLNGDSIYWWNKDRVLMDSLLSSMKEEMFYEVIPLSKFNSEWH